MLDGWGSGSSLGWVQSFVIFTAECFVTLKITRLAPPITTLCGMREKKTRFYLLLNNIVAF